MKKVIFFDFGDVLVFYDHMRGCRSLAPYSIKSAEKIYEIIFRSKLETKHYNKGEYTDQEWYTLCVQKLGLSNCSYELFTELWGAIFTSNPAIEPVLARINPRIKKFVLSNTNGLHWSWAQKNLPVLSTHFMAPHQAILSCEEKTKKPERLIYERALKRAGVQASEAVFVDDKDKNILAFEKLGGCGIVYNAHSTNILHLEKALQHHGCLM